MRPVLPSCAVWHLLSKLCNYWFWGVVASVMILSVALDPSVQAHVGNATTESRVRPQHALVQPEGCGAVDTHALRFNSKHLNSKPGHEALRGLDKSDLFDRVPVTQLNHHRGRKQEREREREGEENNKPLNCLKIAKKYVKESQEFRCLARSLTHRNPEGSILHLPL